MGTYLSMVIMNFSQTPYFLIVYFFLPCFLIIFISIKKLQAKTLLPPGPNGLPLMGNLHQLQNPLHKSLQQLSDQYGDLMFLQLGSVPTIVISSADMVREIFRTHDVVFSGRPGLYAALKLNYNQRLSITFSPYGDYWREIKKIATLELLSSKRVQSFQVIRAEEVMNTVDSITRSSSDGHLVNLSEQMFSLSNTVVCRVAFGQKYDDGEKGRKIREMLHEMQELVGTICVTDFFPWMGYWIDRFRGVDKRLGKISRELNQIYEMVIKEHLDPNRPTPEKEDFVDVLFRLQKDSNQAISLSNEAIKSLFTDIFTAGTDTSAATLVWTMTELIRNPSAMKKAQEEVRKAAKGKAEVEENDLPQLHYLKCVVKESLRVHLPAPLLVQRETTEDCVVKGYKIAAKTRVFINASAISMDPKLWENPGEFRPERFEESSIDFRGQHFELIPFGVGRRGCPGINFAVPLVELALANLLHRFDWELPRGMTRADVDLEEAFGITMHKKVPLCLVATPVRIDL